MPEIRCKVGTQVCRYRDQLFEVLIPALDNVLRIIAPGSSDVFGVLPLELELAAELELLSDAA